jgi:hypothetical protein
MKCPFCYEKIQVYRIDDSEYRFHCTFCDKDVVPTPDKKVEDIYPLSRKTPSFTAGI